MFTVYNSIQCTIFLTLHSFSLKLCSARQCHNWSKNILQCTTVDSVQHCAVYNNTHHCNMYIIVQCVCVSVKYAQFDRLQKYTKYSNVKCTTVHCANRYTRLENLAWSHSVFIQLSFCRIYIFMKPLLLLHNSHFCRFRSGWGLSVMYANSNQYSIVCVYI